MINISKVWCGLASGSDGLRYGEKGGSVGHGAAAAASARKPVVVWNMTRTCNLHCVHCYTDSENKRYPGEMTRDEITRFLRDLADYGVPALLLSGGEPMTHTHFWDVAREAVGLGLRLTLSTNGTLIGLTEAKQLKRIGFTYIGISLDGIGEINDQFRGRKGAFDKAVAAFRHCRSIGQRVGLRMTLTRHNIECLGEIFDFIETEKIPRACFYHLAYTGRGCATDDVTPELTRDALDLICERAYGLNETEILTVANAADGPYLLMKAERERHPRLEEIRRLLGWNRGNHHSSGTGIANVDFMGNVHPDQFWRNVHLGNVREKPFSSVWSSSGSGLLSELRDRRRERFTGDKCRVCKWFDFYGGGLRARAEQAGNGTWGDDPGCYLTQDEIAGCLESAAI